MKRIFGAGLLALPLFLASGPEARAQGCPSGNCGFGGRFSAFGSGIYGNHHLGCGGFCFRFLGAIHSQGPLFNYGPYAGYYPFAPYGPWDASLNWVGPYPPSAEFGWKSDGSRHGWKGDGDGLFGHGGKHGRRGDGCDGCGGWGDYSKTTLRNVKHRIFPLSHKAGKSCDSCGHASAPEVKPATDVVQTGYPRTER
jgi:hypothetical protein